MSYTELDHPKDKEPGGVKAYHRLNNRVQEFGYRHEARLFILK